MVQVPQRLYSLDELRLNGIDPSSLLSPVDTTLGSIERNLQFTALLGGLSAWVAFGFSQLQVLIFSVGLLFLWSVDLVRSLSLCCFLLTCILFLLLCLVIASSFAKLVLIPLIEVSYWAKPEPKLLMLGLDLHCVWHC